ncbi:hypothetical protein MUP77_01950 [Candidatus Bathyarchaeota archaeon]|nr:hypothetical protein [Candidatus Bathyarchaeota archaeon]
MNVKCDFPGCDREFNDSRSMKIHRSQIHGNPRTCKVLAIRIAIDPHLHHRRWMIDPYLNHLHKVLRECLHNLMEDLKDNLNNMDFPMSVCLKTV